jgi:hypothetical protein
MHLHERFHQGQAGPQPSLRPADRRIDLGKKSADFTMGHDLAVQETLLRASGMWTRE